MTRPEPSSPPSVPRLRVVYGATPETRTERTFDRPFRIGRTDDCEVCIKDEFVSRAHVEGIFHEGQWWVRDLNSANGMFVNGERMPYIAVGNRIAVRLGIGGPFVGFAVEPAGAATQAATAYAAPARQDSGAATQAQATRGPVDKDEMARYMERYFAKPTEGEQIGEHTMIMRQAFAHVQRKQRRKYVWVIAALVILACAAGGYALMLHEQTKKQRALAQNLFYSMKSLDVDIANVERLVSDSNNAQAKASIQQYQSRRREMEKNYDQFLSTLKVYEKKLTPQDRLILRIARIFGECELDMPPEFTAEVNKYIDKWKSSGRLTRGIRAANLNGYTPVIAHEFLAQDLPPQFFYLALQESDFDPLISGPPTRKGIAKGMWQFIPETAVKYGLRIGPLADFRRADPGDDRHHWEVETRAAARYIKDLYSTDAQASGLLVMACYNWGENQVLPFVRTLPANPRERNFWKLLINHRDKIPQETYDYVFYITSAAVIGEDPHLFGFDFDNPLAQAETH